LIFYRTVAEQQEAIAAIAEVQKSLYELIVTEVVPFEQFYPAETYH